MYFINVLSKQRTTETQG